MIVSTKSQSIQKDRMGFNEFLAVDVEVDEDEADLLSFWECDWLT